MGDILVGLDGSAGSLLALRWAAWFASSTQRGLRPAHAWQYGRPLEDSLAGSAPPPDVDGLESALEDRLRELAQQELDDPTVVTECRALRGPALQALRDEAERTDASLIVVGARGTGGALRVMLGSVSRQLIHYPMRAVAVVPDYDVLASRKGPIVVGVDGSAGSSRALRWATDAAHRTENDVIVVHAFEPPLPDLGQDEVASLADEVRQRLDEEWCAPLRSREVPYRPLLEPGDARTVIQRVADRVQPGLVVVGSRGLGPVGQRLPGSVAHHLVRELDWPTVIVPGPRDRVVWRI